MFEWLHEIASEVKKFIDDQKFDIKIEPTDNGTMIKLSSKYGHINIDAGRDKVNKITADWSNPDKKDTIPLIETVYGSIGVSLRGLSSQFGGVQMVGLYIPPSKQQEVANILDDVYRGATERDIDLNIYDDRLYYISSKVDVLDEVEKLVADEGSVSGIVYKTKSVPSVEWDSIKDNIGGFIVDFLVEFLNELGDDIPLQSIYILIDNGVNPSFISSIFGARDSDRIKEVNLLNVGLVDNASLLADLYVSREQINAFADIGGKIGYTVLPTDTLTKSLLKKIISVDDNDDINTISKRLSEIVKSEFITDDLIQSILK